MARRLPHVAFVALIVLAACGEPPPDHSAQRLECLRGCAAMKDACIVAAQSALAVQQCDSPNRECVASCPR